VGDILLEIVEVVQGIVCYFLGKRDYEKLKILIENVILKLADLAVFDLILVQNRRYDVRNEILRDFACPLVSLLPICQLRHQDVCLLLTQQAELSHFLLVNLNIAASMDTMSASAEEVVEEGLWYYGSLDQVGYSHVGNQG
jgi:hypothetical protein